MGVIKDFFTGMARGMAQELKNQMGLGGFVHQSAAASSVRGNLYIGNNLAAVYANGDIVTVSNKIGCYGEGLVYKGNTVSNDSKIGCYKNGAIFIGTPSCDKQTACYGGGFIYAGTVASDDRKIAYYEGDDDGAAAAFLVILSEGGLL